MNITGVRRGFPENWSASVIDAWKHDNGLELVKVQFVHWIQKRHGTSFTRLDELFSPSFGAEEETSAHILCECEALASLRHAYLGSYFLEPEDIKSISVGAIWNFSKVMNWYGAQRVHQFRPRCIGTVRSRTQLQSINQSFNLTVFTCKCQCGVPSLQCRLTFPIHFL